MAHAYTPGLRVAKCMTLRKRRVLPLLGEVIVEPGSEVLAEDVVAKTDLPGNVHPVNVVNRLGIQPSAIREYMLKVVGEDVEEGEPIAETRPWIRWLKTTLRSPVKGSVESISTVTGQVMLREPPRPIEVAAYVSGTIVEVQPREGATIESAVTLVQGIFGIGGETWGVLDFACDTPADVLEPSALTDDMTEKVVVVGSLASAALIDRAKQIGVRAIIAGGIHDSDLRELLGFDLGVAITGSETIGLTLVLTEGFGEMPIADGTFDLLQSRRGAQASVSGATQIRAGVLRPEIIIPWPAGESPVEPAKEERSEGGMQIGDAVRVIREPYFGQVTKVVELPSDPVEIETEAKVRIARIELPDGQTAVVPRANLELIQT